MCKARDRKARIHSYLFDFMWEARFQLCIEGPKPRPQSQFRGRGVRHLLSQRFYAEIGQPGAYTRRSGLDRETNKALLLQHIKGNAAKGARMQELIEVLRHPSRDQVQGLLRELKREGQVWFQGTTKGGRWFPRQGGLHA